MPTSEKFPKPPHRSSSVSRRLGVKIVKTDNQCVDQTLLKAAEKMGKKLPELDEKKDIMVW